MEPFHVSLLNPTRGPTTLIFSDFSVKPRIFVDGHHGNKQSSHNSEQYKPWLCERAASSHLIQPRNSKARDPNKSLTMSEFEEQEDRLLAYASLSTSSGSLPGSARTRMQAMGSGIVQRRYRMATESFLMEQQGGIGLQSLSRSRMATSPLVNLVDPTGLGTTSGVLSKSVSFQNIPADFSTRYIDEVKIQRHIARAQSASSMSVYQTQQSKRLAAYKAASNFAKGKDIASSFVYLIIHL